LTKSSEKAGQEHVETRVEHWIEGTGMALTSSDHEKIVHVVLGLPVRVTLPWSGPKK
jgi:hypothetical protein